MTRFVHRVVEMCALLMASLVVCMIGCDGVGYRDTTSSVGHSTGGVPAASDSSPAELPPDSRAGEHVHDDSSHLSTASAEWQELAERSQQRLTEEGARAIPGVLRDLLAFSERHPAAEESAFALYSYARLSQSAGMIEGVEDSLRRARALTADTSLIAAIDQALVGLSLRVGAVPPNFSVKTLDGKAVTVADFKGQVVLLDFWATWCPPCLAELPHLRDSYANFRSQGFEIISISLDADASTVARFVAANDMPWIHVHNGSATDGADPASIYAVESIPTMVLVGRDGRISALNPRGPRLIEAVAAALAQSSGEVTDPEGPNSK